MNSVIILAGGSGTRMGPGVDKLMIKVGEIPLLGHTLLAFETCHLVEEIVLVVRRDRREGYRTLAEELNLHKLNRLTEGGVERQDSVWNGLQQLASNCEWVGIHDGARSLVTPELIARCFDAARLTGAAIPACRVKDTIKLARTAEANVFPCVEKTIDRSSLWIAQTPQVFRKELIKRAYEPLIRNNTLVTDCASAVERLGERVSLVESDPLNLKITTPEDVALAESILSSRKSV